MKIDLSDMNILVTGASRGIGHEITKFLADAGATVAIHFKRNKKMAISLAKEIGNDSDVFQADLKKSEECFSLFERVLNRFGYIDVLVNNAGVFIEAPLEDSNKNWLSVWHKTIDINLTSTGILCRAAIKHFLSREGGRIINIASRAAFRGDAPEYLAYAASKGGMVSLTRSIARGYGKKGVKAFIIAPGFVRTDMAQSYFDIHGEEVALKDIALPYLTEPGDVASFIVFLASGLADHATGCTIDINAGSYFH